MLNDAEFLDAFQNLTLPAGQFNHQGHLRLCWLTLRRHGFGQGGRLVSDGIRRFAASKGAVDKYHETITQFWLRIVYHAMQSKPEVSEFPEFLSSFPFLLKKDLHLGSVKSSVVD
jgi:hypothetical protein